MQYPESLHIMGHHICLQDKVDDYKISCSTDALNDYFFQEGGGTGQYCRAVRNPSLSWLRPESYDFFLNSTWIYSQQAGRVLVLKDIYNKFIIIDREFLEGKLNTGDHALEMRDNFLASHRMKAENGMFKIVVEPGMMNTCLAQVKPKIDSIDAIQIVGGKLLDKTAGEAEFTVSLINK